MTKSEALSRLTIDSVSETSERTFKQWLEGNIVVATVFSSVLLAMAFAGGYGSPGPSAALAQGKAAAVNKTSAIPEPPKVHFSKECAARDAHLLGTIERLGEAGTYPAAKIHSAVVSLFEARAQCRTDASAGLQAYGSIPLAAVEAAAQEPVTTASAQNKRAVSPECAARDLQVITDIEDAGSIGKVPAENLAAAYEKMIEARGKCRISVADGLRLFNEINLSFSEASAK